MCSPPPLLEEARAPGEGEGKGIEEEEGQSFSVRRDLLEERVILSNSMSVSNAEKELGFSETL